MPQPTLDINDTIERLVRLLTKNRWWIGGTATVVALATFAVQSFIPNKYRSEAILLVVRPVAAKYVETAPISPNEAVLSLTAEVLSRTQLLGIINEFGLYAKEKARLAPEDLVDVMKKDLEVEPVETIPGRTDYSMFRIAFTAPTAELARDVTSRLTAVFIEGNSNKSGREATATTNFLTERVAAAKRQVAAQEERLRAFKAEYLGELPEQQGSNLGVLTDLRLQLQAVGANISRAQQQIQVLEGQKTTLQATVTATLTRQQGERTALLNRFTARHPEVQAKDQEIGRTQALLDRLRAGNLAADRSGAATPDDLAAAQLKAQMDSASAEIESMNKQEARLNAEVGNYQRKLNLTPVREQQLKEILRDYDLYNKNYSDLLNNRFQAQSASNLEERQEGQQFRLADPPTVPSKPSAPKRLRIAAGGVAGGLLLGVLLAFLMDRRDSSFYSEKALKEVFPVPLVLGVPVLLTAKDIRTRKVRGALEWAAGTVLAMVVGAAGFFSTQ